LIIIIYVILLNFTGNVWAISEELLCPFQWSNTRQTPQSMFLILLSFFR